MSWPTPDEMNAHDQTLANQAQGHDMVVVLFQMFVAAACVVVLAIVIRTALEAWRSHQHWNSIKERLGGR